jgi:AraC family transcriptional regulator
MHIVWEPNSAQTPYLFRQQAQWNGVRVHRARVMPGRMLEHKAEYHEINVSIAGHLVTEKISAVGKCVLTKGGAGNLCLTPAGQLVGAAWDKPLDNLGILLDPEYVRQTAAENRFSANFEFVEVYQDKDPLIQHIGLALLAESSSATPAGRLYAESLTQTLTLHLLKNYSTAGAAPENASGGLSGYRLRRVRESTRISKKTSRSPRSPRSPI